MEKEPEARFLAEAHRLGDVLLSKAHERADGSLFWTKKSAQVDAQGKANPAVAIGPHLYAGHVGIALFLAALGSRSSEDRFRNAALQTLIPLRRQLQKLTEQEASFPIRLGAITGLGSFIYSFLRMGAWLKRPELVEEACAIAALVTPERIVGDRSADLLSGSAGVLLVLLLLEEEAPPAWRARLEPLATAVDCGEHLLSLRIRDGEEFAGWPNAVQPPSSGLAHGASGIVLALARLFQHTGRDDFWSAALEGLAFERRHFDPAIDNWWPVHTRQTRLQLNAWCNGGAGIALARLSALRITPSRQIEEDLEQALASVCRAEAGQLDSLCCGKFGRAEILWEASQRLGRKDLLERAQLLALATLDSARQHHYRTNSPGDISPGFFTGIAGIGYSLLRLAGNSDLPCILAIE